MLRYGAVTYLAHGVRTVAVALGVEHSRGHRERAVGNTTVSFRQGGRSHTVRGFGARAGYNLAAGLGTVNGQYFVPELARLAGRLKGR